MNDTETVELHCHGQLLAIAPRLGGGILAYSLRSGDREIPVLRPCCMPVNAETSPLQLSLFPLIPYANRIRHGHFSFGGHEVRMPLNFGDHPHSIHGLGWQAPWSVVEQRDDRAVLRRLEPAGDWPWAYEAIETFTLSPAGLCISLSATNTGSEPMPVTLGFHPFYPGVEDAVLTASVSRVWRVDHQSMPIEREPIPARWSMRDGLHLAGSHCDNTFEGWDGSAEIRWPARGLRVNVAATPSLDRLTIYTPSEGGYFCVEPVSGITDAFNRRAGGDKATGTRILAPGERFEVSMQLAPSVLDP